MMLQVEHMHVPTTLLTCRLADVGHEAGSSSSHSGQLLLPSTPGGQEGTRGLICSGPALLSQRVMLVWSCHVQDQ